MVEVKFYDNVADEFLKFAVIISKTDNKWVFCKHKERETYEIPGGHREPGESILETAKRELQEETGADDLLTEAILKLPEQQRHVIWLKYYHGYSLREISKMLGITLSWAQKIDQRAKKQLEILYKEGGGEF